MNLLNLFNPRPKPTNELQAELKALVKTIILKEFSSTADIKRYERILTELYTRGVEPEITVNKG